LLKKEAEKMGFGHKKAACEEEKRGMEILKNNPNVHSQVKSMSMFVLKFWFSLKT